MRFINAIFTANVGERWANDAVLPLFEAAIDKVPMGIEKREALLESVRFFLVGKRTRYAVPNWLMLRQFEDHAAAFEASAVSALGMLCEHIRAQTDGVVFDAVLTTTSTGNLMPGVSYRLAHLLGPQVRSDGMLIDLGNVGCTGSMKALHLARGLDAAFENILVVAVECPSSLMNWTATEVDVWQGNATFGDGAAALWVSADCEQGEMALGLDHIHYTQRALDGLELIRWGYDAYYTFRLADEKTFNKHVRAHVSDVLSDLASEWLASPYWAIHPAGIALLMRLGRKLGLSRQAIQASVAHYDRFSNMSSASIVHLLKEMASAVATGTEINLLTMGAGFNVIYGRVRKDR